MLRHLTPAGSTSFVGGFFFSRDLFPRESPPRFGACPSSNVAEMFYMLAPDVRDSVFKARVLKDVEAGKRLGVVGTPTFLVNDLLIRGAIDSVQLSKYVRDALRNN